MLHTRTPRTGLQPGSGATGHQRLEAQAVRVLCPGCGMSVLEGTRCPGCAVLARHRDTGVGVVEADRADLW
jgi:hypothetical protein